MKGLGDGPPLQIAVFHAVSSALFLGGCGTRSAVSASPFVLKTGFYAPVFSIHQTLLGLAQTSSPSSGKVPSPEDSLEKRFRKAKPLYHVPAIPLGPIKRWHRGRP
jgi:hypothetical protein